MKRFNHGDKALIGDKRVIFGSTRRYYEEVAIEDARRVAKGGLPCRDLTVDQKLARSLERGYAQHWIRSEDEGAGSDPSILAAREAEDAQRRRLAVGGLVELDSRVFRVDQHYSEFRLVDLTLGYTLNASNDIYKTVEEARTVAATLPCWTLWRSTSVDGGTSHVIEQSAPETFADSEADHVPTLADEVAFNDERDGTTTPYRLQRFDADADVWNHEPDAPGELASLIPLLLSTVEVDPTVGWRLWPA